MTHEFDKDYWEAHWQGAAGDGAGREVEPNPHLARETRDLVPGSALDAGCGEGAEAIFLAVAGWQVTAVDIAAGVLARAAERAGTLGVSDEGIQWVEADLSAWDPGRRFDLVTTHYAHPAMPQLAFYERIADWVAPGGTLLIVGHLHRPGTAGHDHGHHPPEAASVTAASVTAGLDPERWVVVSAAKLTVAMDDREGRSVERHDVVVRATRRP